MSSPSFLALLYGIVAGFLFLGGLYLAFVANDGALGAVLLATSSVVMACGPLIVKRTPSCGKDN